MWQNRVNLFTSEWCLSISGPVVRSWSTTFQSSTLNLRWSSLRGATPARYPPPAPTRRKTRPTPACVVRVKVMARLSLRSSSISSTLTKKTSTSYMKSSDRWVKVGKLDVYMCLEWLNWLVGKEHCFIFHNDMDQVWRSAYGCIFKPGIENISAIINGKKVNSLCFLGEIYWL